MRVKGPDGLILQFPDDTPPEVVKAAMAKHYSVGSQLTKHSPYPGWLTSAEKLGGNLLPVAGGAIGGIVGTTAGGLPGGIQGATLGGALGETGRRALREEPLSPLPIAHEGASQGLQQLAGAGVGSLAQKAAVPIMRRALGVGRSFKGFMGPAETAVDEGLTKSAGGLAKAGALREQSVSGLMSILQSAKSSGSRLSTKEIGRSALRYLNNPAIPPDVKLALAKQFDDYMGRFGGSVDPIVAKGIKQYWQGLARSGYGTAEGSGQLAAVPKKFARLVASGARSSLENIPGYGSQIGAQEGRTQSIMGAERAIKAALERPPGSGMEALKPLAYPAIGGALGGTAGYHSGGQRGAAEGFIGGALFGGGLRSSRVAVVLGSPWFRALASQSPRAAAALINELSAAPADATQ